MDLLIETFPTEPALVTRTGDLEKSGRKIIFQGKASETQGLLLRIWPAAGAPASSLTELKNGFVLVAAPS